MKLRVACIVSERQRRYRDIAGAMAIGIKACGDEPIRHLLRAPAARADVAVIYGWKHNRVLRAYPQWLYADLGYWERKTHYRICVGDWSPHRYVSAGLPASRLASLGVQIKPWQQGGGEKALLLGVQGKSMREHGYRYMQWETATAKRLLQLGLSVVYRPKPTDPEKAPMNIDGVGYDDGPLDEAIGNAKLVVAHHSNAAIDALVAGVPVHCETGAAAAFSVPICAEPEQREGREQFLADVAWLQWSLAEMRSGAAWAHLKERGLIRC
jgi:hypothetical protein